MHVNTCSYFFGALPVYFLLIVWLMATGATHLKPDPPLLTCQRIINVTIPICFFTQISLLQTSCSTWLAGKHTFMLLCCCKSEKVKQWSTMNRYAGVVFLFLSTILFQGANTQSKSLYLNLCWKQNCSNDILWLHFLTFWNFTSNEYQLKSSQRRL